MARPRSVQGTWSGDTLHESFQTASRATLGTKVPKFHLDSKRPPPILRAGVLPLLGVVVAANDFHGVVTDSAAAQVHTERLEAFSHNLGTADVVEEDGHHG